MNKIDTLTIQLNMNKSANDHLSTLVIFWIIFSNFVDRVDSRSIANAVSFRGIRRER